MMFKTWLLKQRNRNDVVGDLAQEAGRSPNLPKSDTLKGWQKYLGLVDGGEEFQSALRVAWAEYQKAGGRDQ